MLILLLSETDYYYYTDTFECLVTILTRPLNNFNFENRTWYTVLYYTCRTRLFLFESTCHKPVTPSAR